MPDFGPERCYHNTFNISFRVIAVVACFNCSVNFLADVSLSAKLRTTLPVILQCSVVSSTDVNTSDSRG